MITYTIKKSSRAKGIRIAVYSDGKVVVTAPTKFDTAVVQRFFNDKKSWVEDKVEFFRKKGFPKPAQRFTKKDYKQNKERVLEVVRERLEFFNKVYGHKYNRVSVKNQSSRWGSCSKKGNLNFNYKIIFLPKAHQDYIVVHELCHLKEFNHSRRFWDLIEKTIPHYQKLKKELASHQLLFR